MLYYLLCNKAVVLEFSYKTIKIAYFLDNIYKYDYTETFGMISWFDVIELLFYFGKTIVVFVMYCFCL